MWRNFKIRTKMLLGFALVLVVFALSTGVTWSLLGKVAAENGNIIVTAIPAQTLCSTLDENAYDLFLAMRSLQYLENEASLEEVRARQADVRKMMDEISAFHAKSPDTLATAYLVSNVLPNMKNYFEAIDQTVAGIEKKNKAFETLTGLAHLMSATAEDLRSGLFEYSMRQTREGANDVDTLIKRLNVLDHSARLIVMVNSLRSDFLRLLASRNFSDADAAMAVLNDVDMEASALRSMTAVPENQSMTDALRESVGQYKASLQEYIATVNELDGLTARRTQSYMMVNEENSKALHLSEERILERLSDGLGNMNFVVTLLSSSTGLSILLGFVIAFLISRSIANPLATIVTLAKRAGDGDLTLEKEDFEYNGRDDLGLLVDALSAMVGKQENAMTRVVEVSGSLADGAGKLSTISEETNASMEAVKVLIDQVSTLSESNGAALEECNAGVEEMSAGADTVAQSATDSAAFIAQTTQAANKAIQTVNSVINGMGDVNHNAMESENKLKQLVASVDSVSSFVSVITGIADQTNLLALNAAIEAARAGEVGRGFAVVAEEVRKLAEESARAAQNVNGIIGELQGGAQASIKATAEAGHMLSNTLNQANQAQGELNEALRQMNRANDSIQNIAAVAEEQAASSKEVAQAIDGATRATMDMVETISNIRRASEETAQSAQGVAEHSAILNDHAESLSEVLSQFRLRAHSHIQEQKPKAKALTAKKQNRRF